MRQRILEGFPLAQALGQYPQIFDRLYCAMVAAGDFRPSGAGAERLADYVEQRQQMKNKIVQALVYPMVLTAVAIGVVAILLTAVVPKVIEQFVHMKQTLPLSTRMLLGASDGCADGGVGADIGADGPWRFPLSPAGSGAARALACVHPAVAGGRQAVAGGEHGALRQTLSILNASAVPLLEAMRISAGVLATMPPANGCWRRWSGCGRAKDCRRRLRAPRCSHR